MKDSVVRIRIISVCILLFAGFLVGRLYMVQIMLGEDFSERAERQYVRPTGNSFSRGTIFFESKDKTLMAAASLKVGYIVAVNPKLLGNAEEAYAKISEIITLSKDDFMAKAGKKTDPYEEIARRVDDEPAKKIDKLGIDGINIYKEKWRYYPGDNLASHVLGFVGFSGEDFGGRYGLEKNFESMLERSEENLYVNFFAEIFSDIQKTISASDSPEADIVSTIEPEVQQYVETQVEKVSGKYSSKLTGAIVIDPKTGEVYAMAADPSFNPNSYQNEKNLSVFTNPLVQNIYEMGSIVKPLTMAAGLDAGVVTANTTYNDRGSMTFSNRTIYNYDKRGRGVVTMQKVLDDSLNTGVAFVMTKLGTKRFADYMFKFGIGELTGIDLPNEAKSLVENIKSNREIEYATASFGQGIAMSPIAITRALSALANRGVLATPHVIKRIEYKAGSSKTISYPPGEQVISEATSKEISRMLTEVVDKALLDGKYKMDSYSVAAKTGTAQISKPGGGYYEDRYLHSFFGYFPSYNPKFLVFIYTVEPKGEQYASHTLTEPFMNITKYLINYYQIPPDR